MIRILAIALILQIVNSSLLLTTATTDSTNTASSYTSTRDAFRSHVEELLLRGKFSILLEDQSKIDDSEAVQQAKRHLASHIVSFLQTTEDPVYSGLSESTDLCAKLLNTWMATCVFG